MKYIKYLADKVLTRVLPKSVFYFLMASFFKVSKNLRFIKAYIRHLRSLPPKQKLDKIIFGIQIAEHCNLNCAYCNHFSPLADKTLMPVEDFRRDVERMAELFNHECDLFKLYGGEPLLHSEIITLMEIARKNFTTGRIWIYTNGILLFQQSPEFWKACHDYDVEVHVTRYNVDIHLPQVSELVKQYGVKFKYNNYPIENFGTMHIDLSGKGNGRKNFYECNDANNCILLGYGKLYTCPFACNIHHFNKKFGVNIPVTESDYIDIYKENDPDKILQRLTEQIPLCNYCGVSNTGSAKWRRSKQEISEWV